MKQSYFRPTLALLGLSLGSALPAAAQYVFTDNTLAPYTQSFDAMSGTVPFSFGTTAIPSMVGVYAEAQFDPQFGNGSIFPASIPTNDGSKVTGNYYHFGYPDDTDRAFGGIAETGGLTGTGYAGIRLKNSSSVPILNLEIQYAMEQWYNSGNDAAAYVNVSYRKSSGAPSENMAALSNGAPGNPWTPVPALTVQAPSTGTVIQSRDGNSPANRRVAQTILTDINIAPGEEIMVRWSYVLNPTTNGNGVSIDDVVITPQTQVFVAQGDAIGGIGGKSTPTTLSFLTWVGASPSSLSVANRTYYVTGALTAADLAGISGENTKIIIGKPAQNGAPAQAGLLVLDDATALSVPIDVAAGSTLRIEESAAAVSVAFGTLAPSSTVVYAGATGAQTIKPASYGRLTLEGAGPKVLGGSVLVNGDLRLSDAKLRLGNFDATITKGSHVVGANANSYVVTDTDGRLRQSVLSNDTEVVYPIGTATSYLPLTLKQSAFRSEEVFAVRVADDKYATYDAADAGIGAPIEAAKSVRKTWFVSEEVKGNANVTLKMQWQKGQQTADFDPAQAYVSHFRKAGFWDRTATEVGATTAAPDTYTLARSGITSFSPFTISSDPSQPLPVELVSFEARRVGGAVQCTWATASEKNNAHFELERSPDGKLFSVIGTVKGAGTSTSRHSYTWQDRAPAAVTAYYRLRQVDTDGKSVYSGVVAVKATALKTAVTASPNPTAGSVVLTLDAAEAATIQGTVTNLVGAQVLRFAQPVSAGYQEVKLDLSAYPAGVYVVRIQTPQGPQTLRVIKQ